MSEVPHPFVEESMTLFENLPETDKNKIYFIHINHTNPLLIEGSDTQKLVKEKGLNIAEQGLVVSFQFEKCLKLDDYIAYVPLRSKTHV